MYLRTRSSAMTQWPADEQYSSTMAQGPAEESYCCNVVRSCWHVTAHHNEFPACCDTDLLVCWYVSFPNILTCQSVSLRVSDQLVNLPVLKFTCCSSSSVMNLTCWWVSLQWPRPANESPLIDSEQLVSLPRMTWAVVESLCHVSDLLMSLPVMTLTCYKSPCNGSDLLTSQFVMIKTWRWVSLQWLWPVVWVSKSWLWPGLYCWAYMSHSDLSRSPPLMTLAFWQITLLWLWPDDESSCIDSDL